MNKDTLMKEIEEEIIHLSSSPLFSYRIEHNYIPVIGEGSLDARIVFIGEAPGKREAMTGKPFCGASGKMLDHLLSTLPLERGSVYITNIVKDRPHENRDPTQEEIDCYKPFLLRQLDIIQPDVIVTLGRFACYELCKEFGFALNKKTLISQIHGSVLSSQGKPVLIPLYHPAVALYNGGKRCELEKDFEILKQFL